MSFVYAYNIVNWLKLLAGILHISFLKMFVVTRVS